MNSIEKDFSEEFENIQAKKSVALLSFSGWSRLPVLLQTETAECGLACLAMMLCYHGHQIDLATLRRQQPISAKGADLSQLADIASHLNLATRAIRIEMEELKNLSLPCIIHWDSNHFVVLKSIVRDHCIIHDPAHGERRLQLKQFAKHFTGIVLELLPTKKFQAANTENKLHISNLWNKIEGLGISLIQLFLLTLVLQIITLLAPLYSQTLIDLIPQTQNYSLLYGIAIGFTLISITQIAISAFRELFLLKLTSQLSIQMSANLYYHLIRLPLNYFLKRHLGDVMSRFGGLSQVRELITHGIVGALLDGLMAVLTLIVLFHYSAALTFIVLAVGLVYGVIRIYFYQRFKQINIEKIIADANESSHFMETMRAIQTLKIFQQENNRQSQWLNKLATSINRGIQISQWNIGFNAIQQFVFGIENIAILLLAAMLVKDGSFTLGMLFAFFGFKLSFTTALNNLISQAINFKMLDIQLERLSDIAFTPQENVNDFSYKPDLGYSLKPLSGKIEVKNLCFRYEGEDTDIFSNVSFTLMPGESLALVGPSGCGKTTLLKCLMGLLNPTSGEIFIDDKPIQSVKHYRSQIAGVMQDDQLVSGSLRDNITLFSPLTDWHRIYLATSKACIHDEILAMPMDYQTLVGDMGSTLSGGQKQRVVLARALYREPRILFLDEATSHLDTTNESLVNQHIKDLAITKIFIAHRPETIKSATKKFDFSLMKETV